MISLTSMGKSKVTFFCTSCGSEAPKWTGQCTSCNSWNTLKEEIVHPKSRIYSSQDIEKQISPIRISDISPESASRIDMKNNELNRVLGGGLVSGSVVLVGGQPGIGKSTLMLQVALSSMDKILYVSGEESQDQIKMRADRLPANENQCYIYTGTDVDLILKQAKKIEAQMMVIDSIQTLSSRLIDATAGSVTQVRECTAILRQYAKDTGTPIFIIGHITKDGSIAGPKLLEHMVDVVLQFEGDQHYSYRILRGLKNRYGSTDEIGIYSMTQQGLEEVANPSELLISQSDEVLSGSAISASLEGQRPLLLETQALVTPSVYGNPQRSTTGFDLRRLSMLLAVLEKRARLPFGQHDVFLNIAGGLKVSDPAVDMAIIVALISSIQDVAVDRKSCFTGEVGLSGEVRAISRIDQRIQEASRLGFTKIFIPSFSTESIVSKGPIQIVPISKVEDLHQYLF